MSSKYRSIAAALVLFGACSQAQAQAQGQAQGQAQAHAQAHDSHHTIVDADSVKWGHIAKLINLTLD